MGSQIQKREAEDIVKKLGAVSVHGTNHDRYALRIDGVLIAHFGVSRDSKKPNGHIPKQLGIPETQALALARCTMTKDQYIERLREAGRLPALAPNPTTK